MKTIFAIVTALLLAPLCIDREHLVHRHAGRDYHPADVHGVIVKGILS